MYKIIKNIWVTIFYILSFGQGMVHGASNISSWKNPKIIQALKKSKVVSITPMKEYLQALGKRAEFDGKVFLIQLEGGIKAVFKSFPKDDMGDAFAEVAAYEASLVLGFPYVPPTTIRQVKGMKGSLQLYVETPIDALEGEVYDQALKEVDPDELANLKLFYFVFGQWDTGPHNILIVEEEGKKHLIAIDNSGIRNHQHVRYGELPFVRVCYSEGFKTNDWDQPFPFTKAQTLPNPTRDDLQKIFGTNLSLSFYQSFKSYDEPFRYVIYQNSLWRQYHADSTQFVKSYTPFCSKKTYQVLQKLNMGQLKKIFAQAKGADFLTPRYLRSILERQEEVLAHRIMICDE